MKKDVTKTADLKKSELTVLHSRALNVLKKLVTDYGIFASTKHGWSGEFHALFGRDSAITADLIFASQDYEHNTELVKKTCEALVILTNWQGKTNDQATGEETGKITHEVRKFKSFTKVDLVQHGAATNQKPWYVDPADGLLKNWDSCDSTPLWVISLLRWQKLTSSILTPELLLSLRSALEWCLVNLKHNDGLAAFLGADLQPNRIYSGLHNQGWKDSRNIYQYADGKLAKQPIKDVFVNGVFWAALNYGAELFKSTDQAFSESLKVAADNLRQKFNDSQTGFLMLDPKTNLHFYAQALDQNNTQLTQIAADVGMCLWAYYEDECIIDKKYLPEVVDRLLKPDIFNQKAGIRDYSLGTQFGPGTLYHGSPHTYWPFVSALLARGLEHFDYKDEALAVTSAYLHGLSNFDSCIELFVDNGQDKLGPWQHPTLEEKSALDQAWTAAGMLYGTSLLSHV